jgi:hypothetical protein
LPRGTFQAPRGANRVGHALTLAGLADVSEATSDGVGSHAAPLECMWQVLRTAMPIRSGGRFSRSTPAALRPVVSTRIEAPRGSRDDVSGPRVCAVEAAVGCPRLLACSSRARGKRLQRH